MRPSLWILISLFLTAAATAATIPYGVFGPERELVSEEGVRVGHRMTMFKSGNRCDVFLRKGRQRPPISQTDLKIALGEGGYVLEHRLTSDPAVNCHGFTCQTLGRVVSLPTDPWINPRDMQVLLTEYYADTGIAYESATISSFTSDPILKKDDLVVFYAGGEMQHSGILRKQGTANWILSKLDEDMVAFTPLDGLAVRYAADRVRIFRAKNP